MRLQNKALRQGGRDNKKPSLLRGSARRLRPSRMLIRRITSKYFQKKSCISPEIIVTYTYKKEMLLAKCYA